MSLAAERRAQKSLARMQAEAKFELDQMWLKYSTRRISSSELDEIVRAEVSLIGERYAVGAAELAALWYDHRREQAEAPGLYVAEPAPPPDEGRWASLAGWLTSLSGPDGGVPDVASLVAGAVQRTIADGHRKTIIRATTDDPEATGWARFATGDETCAFCFMLVHRGDVYSSDTVKFGAHDNCDCGAAPVFRSEVGELVGHGRRGAVNPYAVSARRIREPHDRYLHRTAEKYGKDSPEYAERVRQLKEAHDKSVRADMERAKAWMKANS